MSAETLSSSDVVSAALDVGRLAMQAWNFNLVVNLGVLGWAVASRREARGLHWAGALAIAVALFMFNAANLMSAESLTDRAILLVDAARTMEACPDLKAGAASAAQIAALREAQSPLCAALDVPHRTLADLGADISWVMVAAIVINLINIIAAPLLLSTWRRDPPKEDTKPDDPSPQNPLAQETTA